MAEPPIDGTSWVMASAYQELEAERDRLTAELEATKTYAKEGWDWLGEALDALGIKDVFGIKDAKDRADAAEARVEQLERERDDFKSKWLRVAEYQRAAVDRADSLRTALREHIEAFNVIALLAHEPNEDDSIPGPSDDLIQFASKVHHIARAALAQQVGGEE